MIEMMLDHKHLPKKPLALRIIPSASAFTMTFWATRITGQITFDVPGSQPFTAASQIVVTVNILANATVIFITMKRNTSAFNDASWILGGNSKLTEIIDWGTNDPSIHLRPNYSTELVKVPLVRPIANNISSLLGSSPKFNQDISMWDMTGVTDISGMFDNCDIYNQSILPWNLDSVTTMLHTFNKAKAFNQDMSSLRFPLVTLASRTGYDNGTTAWRSDYKPNFLLTT